MKTNLRTSRSPTRTSRSPLRTSRSPPRTSRSPPSRRTSRSPRRTSPRITTLDLPRTKLGYITEKSANMIKYISIIIISSLHKSHVHLSKHLVGYITLIVSFTYKYLYYCLDNVVSYSSKEMELLISNFIKSIQTLIMAPQESLKEYEQDIKRCVYNVGSESALSYIFGNTEKKDYDILLKLKTDVENTNYKISSDLIKIKNEIELGYINRVLLPLKIFKNQITNFPETINKYMKKLIKSKISSSSMPKDIILRESNSIKPYISTIEKFTNELQIKDINLETLISMIERENEIHHYNDDMFNKETVCGRTASRIFTSFQMTTGQNIERITATVNNKLEEHQYFLKEKYDHVEFIVTISLIIVLSLLVNKGIAVMFKKCCRKTDGKRKSRKRRKK